MGRVSFRCSALYQKFPAEAAGVVVTIGPHAYT